MTAIFMDGFDHYGQGTVSSVNMLAGSYAYSQNAYCNTPSWGAARTGNYCLRLTGFAPSGNRYALPTPGTHFFVSFGFAVDNLGVGTTPWPIVFRTNTAAVILNINVLPNGQLQVVNSVGTVLATSNGPVVHAETWHFFEMGIDTSAHTFVLRVDDPTGGATPLFNVTDGTITGTIALVGILENSNNGIASVDDLFIRDNLGTVNNGFLGDRRIATQFANADTTTAGWTPNFYQKIGAGILNNTVTSGTFGYTSCLAATGVSNLNIGSSDFTLESFVRFQALPVGATNKAVIFGSWGETTNQRSYQLFLGSTALNNGSLCWQTSTDGTVSTVQQPIVYPWTPNLDQWYHIAIVRASNQDFLFVDGQQLGLPIADSRTYFAGTAPWCIGGQEDVLNVPLATQQLQGWFDESRFTNGYARYTTSFTPTTVAFTRGVGDTHWANVAFLAGYDSVIQDESGFTRTLSPWGSTQQVVTDGPLIGSWSTVGKAVPDDNTFLSAPFVAASSVLTITVNPSNGNTVTVGTKNGATAAVYTFKTALASAFDVLIDVSIQQTLQNLYNAINAGPGAGTKYGTATTSNFDVNALQLPAGQMKVVANAAGTAGNAIATSVSGVTGSWTGTTLAGGLNIPGPSNFSVQRLPPTTTIVSAIQVSVRAFKSDAGLGSVNSALIGPLGGVATGPTHNLAISPDYYNDIYETDPDTSGPISPTTLTNGKIQINRDT